MENELSRRDVIAGVGAAATLGVLSHFLTSEALAAEPKEAGSTPFVHKLPPLPYPEDALEPVIDKETVKIHHDMHFGAYVKGLNATLEKLEKARTDGNFDAIKALSRGSCFSRLRRCAPLDILQHNRPESRRNPDGPTCGCDQKGFRLL